MLVLVLVMVLAAGCGRRDSGPPMDAGVVRTTAGLVRGDVAADHRQFSGIPYAAPPVGPLRWEPPAPAPAWTGARDATRPGLRCVQDAATDLDPCRARGEDCLNLNVWTPPPSNVLRPVLVWIHGGGFANGSGDVYNARRLAGRGDIVVVTINYRLGALGFLAHPALGPPGAVGNYGLADQQAALRWVRDNIANFGGDPGKVTIGGESAGGMSVCDHLVAPGSAGLFRAAIIQSAPCQSQDDLPTAQTSAASTTQPRLGCGPGDLAAQCLRAVPADKLQRPPAFSDFGGVLLTGPVTGTAVLPVDPVTAFAEGRAARVPVLIGSNRDEFTIFAALRVPERPGDGCRQLSAAALRNLRRRRRCGRRALPAGSIRRQRAAGLLGRGHRSRDSRALPTGSPTNSPRSTRCMPTSSTIAACPRQRCSDTYPSRSAPAIRSRCATCWTSAESRR